MFSPCSEKQKTGSDCIPASAARLNVSVQTAEGYSEFLSSTLGKMARAVYRIRTYPQSFMRGRNWLKGAEKSWICGFYYVTLTQSLKHRKIVSIFPLSCRISFQNLVFSFMD